MSATTALFLLMEATSSCGFVAPDRLGGGAAILEAILDVEVESFEPPSLARAGLAGAGVEGPVGANPEPEQPDDGPAAGQCKVPIVIA